jgi:hypothetical protein
MICGFCASEISKSAVVCPQCGAPRSRLAYAERAAGVWSPGFGDQAPVRHTQREPPVEGAWRADPALSAAGWALYGRPDLPVRSFRKNAVFAFLLYFPFFLPGLIASIVWWNEANRIERRTGIAPRGKGCLTALLVYGVLVAGFWLLMYGIL